ncbi:MAG TPA: hypothetical protein VG297_20440 [Bryobacteraceae bacterium]|jgi:hypothetical protein|nr:hypothetical protein [Bryobacteraceae bacterium]
MIQEKTLTTADLASRGNAAGVNGSDSTAEVEGRVSLFPADELTDCRKRWESVQSEFVDDPRSSVRKADELVASLMSRLAEIFADERGKLEHEWDKGESVSTEDLRLAFQRYRSFFDRLLSV